MSKNQNNNKMQSKKKALLSMKEKKELKRLKREKKRIQELMLK